MYASIEFKIYFFTFYCLCNLLHAFKFHNKNENKHQILSSVYDVIKINENEKKLTNSDENPSMDNKNLNTRRYSFEDYEYGEPYADYAVAETNHEHYSHHKPQHHSHHQKHKELVCYHTDKHHYTKVHEMEGGTWNKLSSNILTLFKFLAILVGSFVAPLILLKLLMLPLKIISLLKFFALVNTFLIGSFLFRFFFRGGFDIFKTGWKNVKSNMQNQNKPNQLLEQLMSNKGNSSELNDADLRLILKYIKKKNKDW